MAAAADDCRDVAVICSICLEEYREPKLLPCFHTFCKACLEQYAGRNTINGKFPCPQCRQNATLPPKGVQGFQENFYITNLRDLSVTKEGTEAPKVQQEKKVKICVKCENNEAKYDCRTCNKILCSSCTKVHKKDRSKRKHHVILIPDDSLAESSQDCLCPKHKSRGEILVYFCQKCKIPICLSCKLTAHEGHPTEDLEDRLQTVKDTLQELNFEVLKHIKDLEELKGSALKLEANLKRNVGELREQVANDKTDIMKAVNGRTKILEGMVQRKAKQSDDSLTKQLNQVQQHLENMEKIRVEAENTLAKGSYSEIQSVTQTMQARLAAVKKDIPKKLQCDLNVTYSKPLVGSAKVENLFGKMSSTDVREKPTEPSGTKTLLTFKVPDFAGTLRMMVASKDGIFICYDPLSTSLKFVSHTGALKQEYTYNSQISSVVVAKDGAVFVAIPNEKSVEIFQPDTMIAQLVEDDLPLKPSAMAAMKTGVVVLGSSATIKCGLLFVDYQTETWIFKDHEGVVLKKPSDVAVWNKGNHTIIIVTDPKAHRVLFFAKQGKGYTLSCLYGGEGLHKDPEQFCPTGVCVDKLGNIFVADTSSRSVIQISKRARLMDDMTITFEDDFVPQCITSSPACNLLVAGANGKVKVIKRGCP